MKTAMVWTLFWILGIGPAIAQAKLGETRSFAPPPSPRGFYCSATAWRAYSVLPKETETVQPIAGTHRVIEQSVKNQENEGRGVLTEFKPEKGGELRQILEFNHGNAISIRAVAAPNGSVNFVIQLTSRVGGKVTAVLGEHRATFSADQKERDSGPLSASLPNLEVSNTYLRLGLTSFEDRNFDKLALSVGKGQLAEGSITEVSVECSPSW